MFIRTPAGTFPGLPEQVLNEFAPSLLILLEVEPEEIARRRRGDSDRVRDRQTIESVRSDLEWGRRTAAACSVVAGVPVSIVRNEQDKQKEAAREIFEIIKEVTK
jgi:adenylate kinase